MLIIARTLGEVSRLFIASLRKTGAKTNTSKCGVQFAQQCTAVVYSLPLNIMLNNVTETLLLGSQSYRTLRHVVGPMGFVNLASVFLRLGCT